MNPSTAGYYRHRFPSEIISHCVWLYFRFSLIFRDVKEMMNERGVTVTYESVREWCLKFGKAYATRTRSRSPRLPVSAGLSTKFFSGLPAACGIWWRAVDQDGEVLDIVVQPRRDKRAAKKFFRKLLKGLKYVPRVIVTDKLGGYAAAKSEVLPTVEHRRGRWLNNRVENSHEPTRERERRMRGFKSPGHAQRCLSVFGVIASFFRLGRHLLDAANYRAIMRRRFTQWRELVCMEPEI